MEDKNLLFRKAYEINEEADISDDDFISISDDSEAFDPEDILVYCTTYAKWNDVKYAKVSSLLKYLEEEEIKWPNEKNKLYIWYLDKETNRWKKAFYIDGNLYDESDDYANDLKKSKAKAQADKVKSEATARKKALLKYGKPFEEVLKEKGFVYGSGGSYSIEYKLPKENTPGLEAWAEFGYTPSVDLWMDISMDDYSDPSTIYVYKRYLSFSTDWADVYGGINHTEYGKYDWDVAYKKYEKKYTSIENKYDRAISSLFKSQIKSESDLSDKLDKTIEYLRSYSREMIDLFTKN